jgi:hypothetical protein
MRVGICEWTTFPVSFEDELAAYRAFLPFGSILPSPLIPGQPKTRSDMDRALPGDGSAVRALGLQATTAGTTSR